MKQVIDTHLHFWDPARLDYPWLRTVPELNRAFLPSDLDTGGVQVERFVFVEAAPEQEMQETDWGIALARQEPRLAAIVASVDLSAPQHLPARIQALQQRPLVKGFRGMFQDHATSLITEPDTLQAAHRIAEAGFTFDACIRHSQLDALTAFAAAVPELAIVLDHMGKPPIRTGDHRQWTEALLAFASLPNTFVKLSGAIAEADPAKDLATQARPYVKASLDAFGPDRSMFGSDWPVSTASQSPTPRPAAYRQWAKIVLDHALEGHSPQERAAVASGTAKRFYRSTIRSQ